MALIILTLQDLPDGTVDVKLNLEPPVAPDGTDKLTMAQQLATVALNAIHNTMREEAPRIQVAGADEMPH